MIVYFGCFISLENKKKSTGGSLGHKDWKKMQFYDAFLEDILQHPLRVISSVAIF